MNISGKWNCTDGFNYEFYQNNNDVFILGNNTNSNKNVGYGEIIGTHIIVSWVNLVNNYNPAIQKLVAEISKDGNTISFLTKLQGNEHSFGSFTR